MSEIMAPGDERLAKRAYEAYGKVTEFKNCAGLPMPKWEDLTDKIKQAWLAACLEVIEVMNED